jgi:predicted AAA+ superfamily ATPase
MITREITNELRAAAAEYPAVTLLGPRQSGKTTLSRMSFPDHRYISLEDPDQRARALEDPRGFLADAERGWILDEIQRVPELLSYLQGDIDQDRRPGNYILTGSHQPRVHQAISQSLAGRTALLELLPFTLSEAARYPDAPESPWEWICRGFYPGTHEHGLDSARFYRSYMGTYVERDLRELIQIRDLRAFELFLRLLAGRVGQLLNLSSLAGDCGVSAPTVRHWISILKAGYILFELPPWFTNIRKRLVKSPKLYFVDVGFAAWLLGLETADQVSRDPLRGALLENLWILDRVKQCRNHGPSPSFHFFRDSHGNEVDFLETQAGRKFKAVEIKSGATFQPEFLKGLRVFEQSVPEGVQVCGELWYTGKEHFTHQGVQVLNPMRLGA